MSLRHRHLEPVWYTYSFLRNLVLAYPIYAIMMLESGTTPLELSVLFALWSLTGLAGEVPSGVLADVWSRKGVLVLAALVKAAGFAAWCLPGSFAVYLLGFMLWGLGGALASGAREALLFDALADDERTSAFGRIYARGEALSELGTVAALMAGGLAAEFGYGVPLAASVAVMLACSVLLGTCLTEPLQGAARAGNDSASAGNAFVATLRAGFAEVRGSRHIGLAVAAVSLLTCIYGVYEEYITAYLHAAGFRIGEVGVLAAVVYGARAAGTFTGGLLGRVGLAGALGLYAVSAACLAAASSVSAAPLVAALVVYMFVCGVADVRLRTNLQHLISSDSRATVTSLAGFGVGVTAIALYLVAGMAAARGGWPGTTAAFAVVTVLLLGPLLLAHLHVRRLPAPERAGTGQSS